MKKALIIESGSSANRKNYRLIEAIPIAQYDLICILGIDCSKWEEIVDEALVGQSGNSGPHPVTTSHPEDKVAEVETFARDFFRTEKVKLESRKI